MKRSVFLPVVALLILCGVPPSVCAAEVIAVAADTNQASSLVGWSAGRSAYYLIFAPTGELLEVLENPYRGQGRGAGPALVDFLARKGVTIIVAEYFGPNIERFMQIRGIRPVRFRGVARTAVTSIREQLKEKDISEKGDDNENNS